MKNQKIHLSITKLEKKMTRKLQKYKLTKQVISKCMKHPELLKVFSKKYRKNIEKLIKLEKELAKARLTCFKKMQFEVGSN